MNKEYAIQEMEDGGFRGVVRDEYGITLFISEVKSLTYALEWLALMSGGGYVSVYEDTMVVAA